MGSGGGPSGSSLLAAAGTSFVTSGRCDDHCGNKFAIYVSILSVCNLIGSLARTGDTILTMRAVEPRDKNFAMGVVGTIFSIFGKANLKGWNDKNAF